MAYSIKEYRVILPMTVEEYQIAQLFAVAEVSKSQTGGGEGVEVIKNEPYVKGEEKGQYTHKIYHLETKVPGMVKKIAPKGSLRLQEEAWNAYPKCKTVLTNDYMGKNFEISIESLHMQDDGKKENVHNLPADLWKKTKVVTIDIANDEISRGDYDPAVDPAKADFTIDGRGKLGKDWVKEYKSRGVPVMCCYKLVKCKFEWFMLQSAVEKMIHTQERKLFFMFHRQLYCSMPNWYGKTLQDIRELEDKTKADLEELRQTGEVRGMSAN